jgi:hypothetical protein
VVSRLDDLGGFLDGPFPDASVGVSECALGGVQARGHRRPALNRDRGTPALIEVPDREDAAPAGRERQRQPCPCGQPEIMCTKSYFPSPRPRRSLPEAMVLAARWSGG